MGTVLFVKIIFAFRWIVDKTELIMFSYSAI